ncbi:baseplate assembly protein, partial [Escherichia coli]|nr:baseplate assembly protein [Escherichia coli]
FRYTGLKPGETVVYNQQGMNIHLTEEGIFIDAKGKDVEINNARNITATATEQVKLVTPNSW